MSNGKESVGGGGRGQGHRAKQARPAPASGAPSTRVASGIGVDALAGAGNQAVAGLIANFRPPVVGVQRDVVSDVEDKMSYGTFDWAITDSEAVDALNELASLPVAALTAAMARLSQTAKSRLLDNLPASARGTSAFTKVLVAMGPDAVQPYVEDLLSYGAFDWAVTDSDAINVFRVFVAIPPAQQTLLTGKLGAKFRWRLADNLIRSAAIGDAEQATLRVLFDATPDAEVDTLEAWMQLRFRIDVGTKTHSGETGQEWDGPSLRRLYNVLQALPPGAVESNPDLLRIDQYKNTGGGSGGYYGSDKRVAVGFRSLTDLDRQTGIGFTAAGDPLVGQNVFDEVVRHEVGHSVDQKLGLSGTYCIGNALGGNWSAHGDGSGLAATLVAASAGAINGLAEPSKSSVIAVLQGVIDDRVPANLIARLNAHPLFIGLPAPTRAAVQSDAAVQALRVSFVDMTPGNPWYRAADDGGIQVGGRIYQEAYTSQWWSYDPTARTRKVSQYQFRAPGEWVAEAYNAYYAPPTKGAVLAASDPTTKAWFDVNVDAATGGLGAGGPGPALPPAATGPGFP